MKVKEKTIKALTLFARGKDGKLITVYQYDAPDWTNGISYDQEREFLRPIIVDGYGFNESLVDILEEREQLKKELKELRELEHSTTQNQIKILQRQILEIQNKKWYQFWKK